MKSNEIYLNLIPDTILLTIFEPTKYRADLFRPCAVSTDYMYGIGGPNIDDKKTSR